MARAKVDRGALREELFDRAQRADLTLPEAVRLMRKIVDKTQPEYAKLAGVSVRILRELERGVGNPSLSTLAKILAPFNLEVTVRRRPRPRDDA